MILKGFYFFPEASLTTSQNLEYLFHIEECGVIDYCKKAYVIKIVASNSDSLLIHC